MASDKNKKLKLLYFLSALLILTIIGLFAILNGGQSFSLISSSNVNIGSDGVPEWVIFLDGTLEDSKYIFSIPAKDLPVYEDKNKNGVVVPQKDLEIQIKRDGTDCVYTLISESGTKDLYDWLPFVENREYYGIGAITRTNAWMLISDNFNHNARIDSLNVGDTITKFKHNGGDLVISSSGGLMSNYRCPQLDNYVIEYNTITKDKKYLGQDLYSNVVNKDGYIGGLFSSCSIDSGKNTKLEWVCNVDEKIISNPTLKITADAKYLDFKFIPTTIGVPEIVEIIEPENVNEASINALSVKVKNIGKENGAFKLYASSDAFTFTIPSINLQLGAGEEQEHSFIFTSPQINEDFDFTTTIKLCSISDFSRGNCVEEDFKMNVKDVGTLDEIFETTNTCGNNVCDANENYATCSDDCSTPLVCDGLNMNKYNNKCVCDDGFTMVEDNFGRDYCSENQDNTIMLIGILSLVLVIFTIMIIIYRRRK